MQKFNTIRNSNAKEDYRPEEKVNGQQTCEETRNYNTRTKLLPFPKVPSPPTITRLQLLNTRSENHQLYPLIPDLKVTYILQSQSFFLQYTLHYLYDSIQMK